MIYNTPKRTSKLDHKIQKITTHIKQKINTYSISSYNYDPRFVRPQTGYIQQQPLVQQQGYGVGIDYPGVKVRDLQPEYVYQQVGFFNIC
jgi:hypothetical protein